jgi:hypothetical protein
MTQNAVGFNPSLLSEALVSSGGKAAISVTPTVNTVIKADIARLCSVLLTSANGANVILFYDNATTNSGTIIGYIPASAVAGTLYNFNLPAVFGITIAGVAAAATMTVSYH